MGATIGFTMAFFVCQYISYIIELKTFGAADMTTFWALTHPQLAESTNIVSLAYNVANAGWDWIMALLNMLTWNFAFFDGWLAIFRVLFLCISAGFVWTIVSLFRGTSSD